MKRTMQALEDENARELKQNALKRQKIGIISAENEKLIEYLKLYKLKEKQRQER